MLSKNIKKDSQSRVVSKKGLFRIVSQSFENLCLPVLDVHGLIKRKGEIIIY